jgi:peptide chain release factor
MSEVIIIITAGDGPKECQWVVVNIATAYCREAVRAGLTADILWEGAEQISAPSCLVKISGSSVDAFIRSRVGTIRWIGQSPFRRHHKRKNWYVSVSRAPDIADVPDLREQDITYQTLKASGPGGQHVNKTESAVRATHRPSGLTVVSQAERSQFANKKITRLKLAVLLQVQRSAAESDRQGKIWTTHKSLERGNEVRIYEGSKFRLRRV